MSANTKKVITAQQLYGRVTDLSTLGYDCLTYCETLFVAIQNAKTIEQAKSIAEVGHCLSTDHAGMFDCEKEQLANDKAFMEGVK